MSDIEMQQPSPLFTQMDDGLYYDDSKNQQAMKTPEPSGHGCVDQDVGNGNGDLMTNLAEDATASQFVRAVFGEEAVERMYGGDTDPDGNDTSCSQFLRDIFKDDIDVDDSDIMEVEKNKKNVCYLHVIEYLKLLCVSLGEGGS